MRQRDARVVITVTLANLRLARRDHHTFSGAAGQYCVTLSDIGHLTTIIDFSILITTPC